MIHQFQVGDIVERDGGETLWGGVKAFGRYVVAEVSKDGELLSVVKGGIWRSADRFILIARGEGLELSQFINKGSQ